jgi:hypothetical protein
MGMYSLEVKELIEDLALKHKEWEDDDLPTRIKTCEESIQIAQGLNGKRPSDGFYGELLRAELHYNLHLYQAALAQHEGRDDDRKDHIKNAVGFKLTVESLVKEQSEYRPSSQSDE